MTNSLPLVTRKGTAARVYVAIEREGGGTFTNVPIRLYIRPRGGEWTVTSTRGRPYPLRRFSAGDFSPRRSTDVPWVWFRVDATVPVELELYAVVDPENLIVETDETDNRFPTTGYVRVRFFPRKSVYVVGQRIRNASGAVAPTNWVTRGGAARFLERMLPVPDGGVQYVLRSGILDWSAPLNDRGQHDLIRQLNYMWMFDAVFGGAFGRADKVYGWLPGPGGFGHADMPRYPHAGGLVVVGISTSGDGRSVDEPGSGSYLFAHEILHTYDLQHTNTPDGCGSDDPETEWPYPDSSIQEVGFNPDTGWVYTPDRYDDVLSYCFARWISPYTWIYMFRQLAPSLARMDTVPMAERMGLRVEANPAQKALLVMPTIYNPDHPDYNPQQPADLGRMYIVESPRVFVPQGQDYALQLRKGNVVLSQVTFSVSFTSEYGNTPGAHREVPEQGPGDDFTGARRSATVPLLVPWDERADNVVLVKDNVVLAERSLSARDPEVSFVNPREDTTWPAGTRQVLRWQGSDPDGDTLTYTLLYSRDDGRTWQTIAVDLTKSEYTLDVDTFAGGEGRFRVIATDGMRTAMTTSARVRIPNKPPVAVISYPTNNAAFRPGRLIVFQGLATDLEDGPIPGDNLQWYSDRDGFLGTGNALPRNDLSPGWHLIRLVATDSEGQRTEATVRILVGYRMYMSRLSR